jgi:Ethanolamine utilization protein EutJ (predicted chaperonin)
LPSGDGERVLVGDDLSAILLGLRARAEKQLARPVTHAVVALPPIEAGPLVVAAREAGLSVLQTLDPGTKPLEAAALEAALLAEDLAPKL